jgi:hypothetical protein
MEFNKDNIKNLSPHLYQYVQLLQMIGYFPYLPSSQIDTSLDERMITYQIWEWGNSEPTLITIPNIQQQTTYLWN